MRYSTADQPKEFVMIRDRFRLDGRVAVVTGGARGIGHAISTALIEQGASVVIADREEESGRAAAGALGCHFVQLDVRDRDRVRAVADEIAGSCGPVDILVNNARRRPSTRLPRSGSR